MLLAYDEHVLVKTFKFGVIYQKFGQVSIFISKSLNSKKNIKFVPCFFLNFYCYALYCF